MLKKIRQQLIHQLWDSYRASSPEISRIEKALKSKNISLPPLDHFAIIDLPGPHSSRANLCQLFSAIGYIAQGCDYLAEKQNDFLWLTEIDSLNTPARDVLPQVVVADFRPEEMPDEIAGIVNKYAAQCNPSPLPLIQNLIGQAYLGNQLAADNIVKTCAQYLTTRDWSRPTVKEFHTVSEFNELLAWVLVFGRRPNHFTYSIHLMPEFDQLETFLQFMEKEVGLTLNNIDGQIKGGQHTGIAQGSTKGIEETVELADGHVCLPPVFMEFVWRYTDDNQHPVQWQDYFTGFVANHANRVIESLYV